MAYVKVEKAMECGLSKGNNAMECGLSKGFKKP